MKDYWADCIYEAFEDAGITATKEQTETVISWVQGGYDNSYQANGNDVADRNLTAHRNDEIKKLQDALYKEKQKRTCRSCEGYGNITTSFGSRSSISRCDVCHGDGRL